MKLRKLIAGILAGAMAAALLAGCGGTETGSEGGSNAENDGKMIVASQGPASVLDPQYFTGRDQWIPIMNMFETLISRDENLEIIPKLAKSWEYTDDENKVLVFHLRDDVKFHNGDPMTAEDVIYSFQRAYGSGYAVGKINFVEEDGMTALDDYTVKLKLKYPMASALVLLSQTHVCIVNKKVCESLNSNEEFSANPVGTGPFKFKSNVEGGDTVLVANEDYYDGAPAIKELVFHPVGEAANRAIELETGGADYAINLLPTDLERLEGDESVQFYRGLGWEITFVGYNMSKAPFDDVNVRKALSMGLDREAIVKAVFGETGQVLDGPLPSSTWGWYDGVESPAYDPEGAKKLLSESGHGDGLTLEIWTTDSQQKMEIAEIVQNQWAEIGVEAKVQVMESGTFKESTNNGEHQVVISGYGGIGEPDHMLTSLYSSEVSTSNINKLFDDEVDALLLEGRNTLDDTARKEIYKELQLKLLDICPATYLWESETLDAYSTKFKPITYDPCRIPFEKFEFAD